VVIIIGDINSGLLACIDDSINAPDPFLFVERTINPSGTEIPAFKKMGISPL